MLTSFCWVSFRVNSCWSCWIIISCCLILFIWVLIWELSTSDLFAIPADLRGLGSYESRGLIWLFTFWCDYSLSSLIPPRMSKGCSSLCSMIPCWLSVTSVFCYFLLKVNWLSTLDTFDDRGGVSICFSDWISVTFFDFKAFIDYLLELAIDWLTGKFASSAVYMMSLACSKFVVWLRRSS